MINENNIRNFIGQKKFDSKGIFVKITGVIDRSDGDYVMYESGRENTIPLAQSMEAWKFCEEYSRFYAQE